MRKTLLLTTVIILVAGLMFAWAGKETGVSSSNSVTNVETPKITIVPNTSIDGLKKEAEIRAMEAEKEAERAARSNLPATMPTLNSQSVVAKPASANSVDLASSVDLVSPVDLAKTETILADQTDQFAKFLANVAGANQTRLAEIKADGVISADEMADYEAISEKLSRKSDGDSPVILVDLDEGEPNDDCATEATAMAVGDRIFCGEINYGDPQDVNDWFVFTLDDTYDIVIQSHLTAVDECQNPSMSDSYLELYSDDCVTQLAYDDDGGEGMMSRIDIELAAGEYNILMRAYSSGSAPGSYHLTLGTLGVFECPDGAVYEDEPICYDEFDDIWNGGCNSAEPYPFGTELDCDVTVCGNAGTYLFTGLNYRDTDWYMFELDGTQLVTASGMAEFPLLMFIIQMGDPDPCTGYTILTSGTAGPMELLTISAVCAAGPVVVWVGPSVFTGVECGSEYWASVTCEDVLGACCDDATGECLEDIAEANCQAPLRWAANTLCDDLVPPCGGCPEDIITVDIFTDNYGSETTWEVVDQVTQEVVGSGGPLSPNTQYSWDVCIDYDGCYDFTIYDSYGDGICCNYGDGHYEVYFNGSLVGSGGVFGASETVPDIGGGCGTQTGACCVDYECVETNLESECDALEGDWYVGEDCATFICPILDQMCTEAGMWENGDADLVNGTRPTVGWDDTGIIEDFIVTDPTEGNCFRVEFLSVTGPALPEAVRIRVYNMPVSGSMYDLDWAVDGANTLFDYTYTKGSGELSEYDTGLDAFGYDLVYYDCCAEELLSLAPGDYVFFVTLPGYGANGFWAKAPDLGNQICAVWGVQVQFPSAASFEAVAWHIGSSDCEPVIPTGACCVDDECVATNTQAECAAMDGDWYANEDCFGDPPFECPTEPTGACCVDEVCVITNTETECDALLGSWFVGETCPEFDCPVAEDPCEFAIWHNGVPGVGGGAVATQCAPDYPFAAGVADDFELGGADPVDLTEVVAWVGHWGGAGDGNPAMYDGVNVTIYGHDATNNMPGGEPIDGDPDCGHLDNMPPDGILYTVFIPSGSFGYADESATYGYDCWLLQLPVTVTVQPNTMYWLEVQPVMAFSGQGQIGWVPTDMQQGAYGMNIFEFLGTYPWSTWDPPTDFAFCLNAGEGPEYCESWGNNSYEWITNVTIVDINNTTGAEPGGYGDYTAISTEVTQGWSHNLSVSFVNDGSECIRAWIDWDQNWTFDADELYEVGYGAPGPFDIDIDVPMDALLGETRMRVQNKWSTCGEPCETGFWGETEDYTLVVVEFPCDVVCEGTDEGEETCYDGYQDLYNAGCNMLPENEPIFGSITCGETICGTSGTHLDHEGTPVRDTDWFQFDVTVEQQFTLTVEAEFQVAFGIIEPGADDPDHLDPCLVSTITYFNSAGPCQVADVVVTLGPGWFGYYWVWVGPYPGVDVECGKEYSATLTCAPPPTGACCIDYECVATNTETECLTLDPWGDWHEGETCPEFVCPIPMQTGLATTQNIPDCGVSNFGPIGETESQGNTYGWDGNSPKNFSGTFVMGNAPDMMFSVYNTLPPPPVSDCYQYAPSGNLDMTDTFHPTAEYSDGGVMGGVDVDYCGHGFHTDFGDPAEAGDIFVHVFTVTNNSGGQIAGYYAGLYIDWDIAADDDVTMDLANNLIHQTDALGQTELWGMCLINDDANSVTAVSQEDYIYPSGPSGGGWRMEDLHAFMSTPGENWADAEFTDMSQLISAGPYTLEDGETVTIQIACIGAANATDMVARAVYAATLDIPECDLEEGPEGYEYVPGDCGMALGLWPPTVIGGDVSYLVGYFIGSGNEPCRLDDFWCSADVTGDCQVIGGDVSALVGYFIGTVPEIGWCGDDPEDPQSFPPAWLTVDPPELAPDGWPNCDAPVLNNLRVIPTDSNK